MIIDLTGLLDKTVYKIDFKKELNMKSIKAWDREIHLEKPIRVNGEVYKTDDGLYLNANISVEYNKDCDRCLKTFSDKIETVLSGRLVDKSRSDESLEEDDILVSFDGDEVDIEEHVLSTVLLSLPMKSVCSEDCKGLCPTCGNDLNEGQCDCDDHNIDPRLAKLKELLD
ncbi:YceD family protein [Dethiothermospora halolimnae]|uniref:YceD family protein n=1 Tax=Dethiothermospora halolimnae TaxID=3114390 RepID=UPI003CCC064B